MGENQFNNQYNNQFNNQYNNQFNQYSFDSDYANQGLSLNRYISATFGWMFVGLMVTFVLAAVLAKTGFVFYFLTEPAIPTILLIAELVVVMVLSARVHKQSVAVSRVLFLVYSVLNGLVFTLYFVIFDVVNLIVIFGLTALFFGAFALYGRFTKTDLSRLRPLLIGGLIFLLIAAGLSFFVNLSAMERGICMAGIVVFLCFTAYDTQKIKQNYQYYSGNAVMLQKASIYSALQLYLDFVNLFTYLLRFMGRSRN